MTSRLRAPKFEWKKLLRQHPTVGCEHVCVWACVCMFVFAVPFVVFIFILCDDLFRLWYAVAHTPRHWLALLEAPDAPEMLLHTVSAAHGLLCNLYMIHARLHRSLGFTHLREAQELQKLIRGKSTIPAEHSETTSSIVTFLQAELTQLQSLPASLVWPCAFSYPDTEECARNAQSACAWWQPRQPLRSW